MIFLDFDGTLTPIVPRPEEAFLKESMRNTIQALAEKYPLAIVSGRDLSDLKKRVGLEQIYYAGSHGFEISGPGRLKKELPEALALLPVLERAERELSRKSAHFEGAQIERKRFSIAVHYRRVALEKQEEMKEGINKISQGFKELKMSYGKKVIELKPNLDWDKGKAVLWLLENLGIANQFPLYIGDDTTDEDAFRALQSIGIGIVIRDEPHDTWADYALESPAEVERFLEYMTTGEIDG